MDPIEAAVAVLADRWTLLILRDLLLEDRKHFRALLGGSAEGIATNILADRLTRLLDAGLVTRDTAVRGQRAFYRLTAAGADVAPIFAALAEWGRLHPVSPDAGRPSGSAAGGASGGSVP